MCSRRRGWPAQQATVAFGDLVRVRADWVADRIITFRSSADKIVEFAIAFYRYQLKLLHNGPYSYEDMTEDDFEAFWDSERELRNTVTSKVKMLTCLPHPPRASLR